MPLARGRPRSSSLALPSVCDSPPFAFYFFPDLPSGDLTVLLRFYVGDLPDCELLLLAFGVLAFRNAASPSAPDSAWLWASKNAAMCSAVVKACALFPAAHNCPARLYLFPACDGRKPIASTSCELFSRTSSSLGRSPIIFLPPSSFASHTPAFFSQARCLALPFSFSYPPFSCDFLLEGSLRVVAVPPTGKQRVVVALFVTTTCAASCCRVRIPPVHRPCRARIPRDRRSHPVRPVSPSITFIG